MTNLLHLIGFVAAVRLIIAMDSLPVSHPKYWIAAVLFGVAYVMFKYKP